MGRDPMERDEPQYIARIGRGKVSFDDLLHLLIAAHGTATAESILQAIEQRLTFGPAGEDFAETLQWSLLLFDERCSENVYPARTEVAALLLLETVAGDATAWNLITAASRWQKFESILATSPNQLDLLEPMLFAPAESPAGNFVRHQLRLLGLQQTGDWDMSRRIERLLHIFDCQEIAYEVEHARKAAAIVPDRPGEHFPQPDPPLAGLRVLVAGGHEALRTALARDLARSGVRVVRALPSRQEASRRERDVSDLMRSIDVALVCVRQIAHSTSDQVKRAGARLGVPVVLSRAASPTSLRRDLETWAGSRQFIDSES